MNHYIKQQSLIKRENKCKKTLFNSQNKYTSYATHLSSKFLINFPSSISFVPKKVTIGKHNKNNINNFINTDRQYVVKYIIITQTISSILNESEIGIEAGFSDLDAYKIDSSNNNRIIIIPKLNQKNIGPGRNTVINKYKHDPDNCDAPSFCCICVGPSYGYTVDLTARADLGDGKPFAGIAPADGWGGTITYEDGQGLSVFVKKEEGIPPIEVADNLTPVSASYNIGYKPCRYIEQLQNGVTIQGKTYVINGDDDDDYEHSSEWILDQDNKKYSVCRNDCDKACCEQCREIDPSSIQTFSETANDPCGFFTSAVNKVCCETAQPYDENNLGSCLCEE
jgi:hypothetical protein